MNAWNLTNEIIEKFKPIIENYINSLESDNIDDINEKYITLTNQGINPIQLKELLEELGYEEQCPIDSNGWQFDFWWYFSNTKKKNYAKELCICGCGITFELILRSDVD